MSTGLALASEDAAVDVSDQGLGRVEIMGSSGSKCPKRKEKNINVNIKSSGPSYSGSGYGVPKTPKSPDQGSK